jgi:hypothetical protein
MPWILAERWSHQRFGTSFQGLADQFSTRWTTIFWTGPLLSEDQSYGLSVHLVAISWSGLKCHGSFRVKYTPP